MVSIILFRRLDGSREPAASEALHTHTHSLSVPQTMRTHTNMATMMF